MLQGGVVIVLGIGHRAGSQGRFVAGADGYSVASC